MHHFRYCLLGFLFGVLVVRAQPNSEVRVIGEMRRMFTEDDIGPNVSLSCIATNSHVCGLGPLAGLEGEITVLDGRVLVSRVVGQAPVLSLEPNAKSVFLVYASISEWVSTPLPENVQSEQELAALLEQRAPQNTRMAFRVSGTALVARYHVQNFRGRAEDLTHEAHEKAKTFFEIHDAPVELVGFFSNREADGGKFVHMGQTTHIHVVSRDRKHMGHLESLKLAPGAMLWLAKEP